MEDEMNLETHELVAIMAAILKAGTAQSHNLPSKRAVEDAIELLNETNAKLYAAATQAKNRTLHPFPNR